MEDLLSELHEYERSTIALRLDEQEAKALTCALVECSCDAHKRDTILLGEKLAHEMDTFKWRRFETVDLAKQRTDNVAMSVNNQEEATMPTKARTGKAAKTKICTRCKKRRKVEQYYRDKHMNDGLSSWCKDCTREYDREYAKRKKAEKEAQS